MKVCSLCGNECDDLREKCPYCGGELTKKEASDIAAVIVEGIGVIAETVLEIIT